MDVKFLLSSVFYWILESLENRIVYFYWVLFYKWIFNLRNLYRDVI